MKCDYDVAVIGAGAAGFMTAIIAARSGAQVLLLDSREKVGAKILMSGGTRCNVTNQLVSEKDYNSSDLMFVRQVLRRFDNRATIAFFKELGVSLVLEETGKYFPSTNTAKSVLEALEVEAKRLNIKLFNPAKVTSIDCANAIYTVKGADFSYRVPKVVLATGGLSYPTTGSDGFGYQLARRFGHTVVSTSPALTPLTTEERAFCQLSGISLVATLTLKVNGKKNYQTTDGFLFTHNGFSGPSALDISRHWLRISGDKKVEVNFLPQMNDQTFSEALVDGAVKGDKRTIKTLFNQWLPERLTLTLLNKAGVKPDTVLNQLTKEARLNLVRVMLHQEISVKGVVGYTKAEVTAGGLSLTQFNPKTLESLHQKGLYAVGEILDVDGRIGGFNFQWAWATGYVVGSNLGPGLPKS